MEAWLTQLYERHRERYLLVAMSLVMLFTMLVVAPGAALFPAEYLGLSARQYAVVLLLTEISGSIVVVSALFANRARISQVAWLARAAGASDAGTPRQPDTPEDAWQALFDTPRRLMTQVFLGAGLVVIPIVVGTLAIQSGEIDLLGFAGLTVGAVGSVATGAAAGFPLVELAMQPIRAQHGFYELRRAPSAFIGRALIWISLGLTFLASSGVGYLLIDGGTDKNTGLFMIYGAAVGGTAMVALALILLVSARVNAPLRRLINSHRGIAAGDLEPIALTTADEFGELAASFNEMVAGLRERESLREHNDELINELRASRARIVASAADARRKVERDLHDGAQQSLVLLNLKLGLLARQIEENPKASIELVEASRSDLQRALEELRDLAHGIYPQVLTSDGLPGALAEIGQNASLPVKLSLDGAGRYPPELEAAVYFCCLEALQNAAKHAGEGAKVTITLSNEGSALRFEVADDGVGFDADGTPGSAGLQNMADRIGALGGELTVESAPGTGTKVRGIVPVEG